MSPWIKSQFILQHANPKNQHPLFRWLRKYTQSVQSSVPDPNHNLNPFYLQMLFSDRLELMFPSVCYIAVFRSAYNKSRDSFRFYSDIGNFSLKCHLLWGQKDLLRGKTPADSAPWTEPAVAWIKLQGVYFLDDWDFGTIGVCFLVFGLTGCQTNRLSVQWDVFFLSVGDSE